MLRGQVNSLPLRCNAAGDENALGFSVSFDPKLLSFYRATTATGTTLTVNTQQAASGKLGLLIALPAGQAFAPGEVNLVNLEFIPSGGDVEATTQLGFDDQIMQREASNTQAVALGSLTFNDARITISGRAAAQFRQPVMPKYKPPVIRSSRPLAQSWQRQPKRQPRCHYRQHWAEPV